MSSLDRLPTEIPRYQRLLGWLTVLGSAVCFYLATAIISWSRPTVTFSAGVFTFARFAIGFAVVVVTMARKGWWPKRTHIHLIIGRTVTNALAVYCFYQAVDVSTVASANILNMTYPIFVAAFSWIFLRDQRDTVALGIVAVATLGVWLILSPGADTLSHGNQWWGLLSGFFAGSSIIYLNLSRRHHDAHTILFYMFGLGSLLTLPLLHGELTWPNATDALFLALCSAVGILGQYLLTYGFLYVTALEGAVISSSRILIAALLGPLMVADPHLTSTGWLGALLLFGANVALALRKTA